MSIYSGVRTQLGVTPSFTPTRRSRLRRKCACGGMPGPTGECQECRKKRLQRNPTSESRNESVVPAIVHEVLRSSGQPLDTSTRAIMEPRLGHDFSCVRVHTDLPVADASRSWPTPSDFTTVALRRPSYSLEIDNLSAETISPLEEGGSKETPAP